MNAQLAMARWHNGASSTIPVAAEASVEPRVLAVVALAHAGNRSVWRGMAAAEGLQSTRATALPAHALVLLYEFGRAIQHFSERGPADLGDGT